jgi:hypothetical protein|mmetsp:Transcript_50368/g.79837  ORF Transcript_50368/g.79837 Transcript_50368/m.79837 type:complete len:725 (+) Transcript_50368:59-2233(+)|eukprot:CAMPEP_0169105234 /NCGR_PEP_ID=MMETSP1015-20121227/23680_1 /TAXON_ID=342587 /ORGANISM="Karlodinium micrum, Strain CCMP2283" /LENGTH=724 /DNA_ID=CAMNT_0009166565 /DNA_START=59 /DNA_END=2233 /DNA_ORIENTATION=-
MAPQMVIVLVVSLILPVESLGKLRGSTIPKEFSPQGFSLCPRYVATSWNGTDVAGNVVAAYNEVEPVNSTGHTMFAALWTNLGSVGLLRDNLGRSYAYLSAPGVAAHMTLQASGDDVDVAYIPAPPAEHGYLSFRGIESVVELDKDDTLSASGSAKPLAFFMRLELDQEAHHWRGWPRSFGYRLAGYVRLPSKGVWRLLAEVEGRIVTDGTSNYGGFLGGFSSFVAPLGKPGSKACTEAGGAGRFGPAWYQVSERKDWSEFTGLVPIGGGSIQSDIDKWKRGRVADLMIAANSIDAAANVMNITGERILPKWLHEFPLPEGDNSPSGQVSAGFRGFGPRQERLQKWGQYYNETRVYSCVTPDLSAVMADPRQYTPPPKEAIKFSQMGFCEPLVAEHFWWTPQKIAEKDIEWFYNEITVEESAPYTYFMANGFAGGYFGIQEHPGGKKYALFSVWDAGSKVEIVDWGEGVKVGRFGAEGTGANSRLEFPWEIGKPVQFLVHASVEPPSKPGGVATTLYSGYIRLNSLGVWRLLSKLRVQPCGVNLHSKGHLLGLNSFIEVFQHLPKQPDCAAYSVTRRARYGVPWYRRAGASSFEPFANVTLTATCGKEGCPRKGMDFQVVEEDGRDAFVLTVGANVTNTGLTLGRAQHMKASQEAPSVLTETALPDSDNSIAGRWHVGEARPLRSLGRHEQLERWGSGPDELACPWYVTDCSLPAGLAEEDYIR